MDKVLQKTRVIALLMMMVLTVSIVGSPAPAYALSPGQRTDNDVLIQQLVKQLESLMAQLEALRNRNDDTYTWSSTGTEIEEDRGPKVNRMSCANPRDGQLPLGAVACYGLHDYGDEFGEDADMCGGGSFDSRYYLQTGCVIPAMMCRSNRAISARHYSIGSASAEKIAELAKNFGATEAAVQKQLSSMWEYECTDKPLTGLEKPQLNVAALERDYGPQNPDWDFVTSRNNIVVVGAYESGANDGSVDVVLSRVNKNTLLVLAAYDTVRWRLSGTALSNVRAILVTGYENQQITNVPKGVSVTSLVYESGSGTPVFYAYEKEGPEFFELQDYLLDKTGYKTEQFFGSYNPQVVIVDVADR
jgi:hypothetical protein